jgi:sodium-dependent dicarboxylate transporter 2/3/5
MLVSMWISNTAATAMVYPVTMGVIGVLSAGSQNESFARSPYASALLLMTAYASTVGGLATPIGTTTNVVAIGLFRQKAYFGQPTDFLRWSLVGVPLMLVLGLALLVWLRLQSPANAVDLPRLRAYLAEQHAQLGRWSRGEVNTLLVFLIVVSLWIMPSLVLLISGDLPAWIGERFPEEAVAMLAPVLLFLLPTDWRARRFSLEADDFRRVDWSTLLLFGAGLSLGTLMFTTGLAKALGDAAFDSLNTSDTWRVTAACIAGAIFLSEFTSNATTATMLIPVVMAICKQADVDPLPPLMGVALGASFGSALPVSTPPNAIVYGSGLIPVRRMIRAGVGVNIVAGVVIWCVLRIAFALGWSLFPQS